jgi:hypothetical protein
LFGSTTGFPPVPSPAGIGRKAGCTSSGQYLEAQIASRSLISLPSYSLNAFSMLYTGLDKTMQTSEGFAVGDRGAIMALGSSAAASASGASQPLPPDLGTPDVGAASDTSAYDAFRPLATSPPGLLPALAARPLETLGRPGWVAGGMPDPTRNNSYGSTDAVLLPPSEIPGMIVMSRDGSEGWALGTLQPSWTAGVAHAAFFHYASGAWKRCIPAGVQAADGLTLVPPDPACSDQSVQEFASANNKRQNYGVITAAARVPLENGPDPSRAADFEAVAVGWQPQDPRAEPTSARKPALLWYRHGRWTVDAQGAAQIAPGPGTPFGPPSDVSFAAPDDGWVLIPAVDGLSSSALDQPLAGIFHFDGKRWWDCSRPANAGPCRDPRGELARLASDGAGPFHLALAGSRIYLSGSRQVAAHTAPVILWSQAGSGWTDKNGGTDVAFDNPVGVVAGDTGRVSSLMVRQDPDGQVSGWAVGEFGPAGTHPGRPSHLRNSFSREDSCFGHRGCRASRDGARQQR